MYGLTTHHVTFPEYKRHGVKAGKCQVCGRTTKRQRAFRMTESPYNKNPDGSIRSPHDIARALDDEVNAWKAVRVICCDCESETKPPFDEGWVCGGADLHHNPLSGTWTCGREGQPNATSRMMCKDCWKADRG